MWRKVGSSCVRNKPSGPGPHPSSRSMEPAVMAQPAACPAAYLAACLAALRGRPLAFLFHYVRGHPVGHTIVLLSVLLAVTCSVSTQYGMKHLIDIVSAGPEAAGQRAWG